MVWPDQGRQEHGWFGHGTTGQDQKQASEDDPIFGPGQIEQRANAVVHGVLGALPRSLRNRLSNEFEYGPLPRLAEAMAAWSRGSGLDRQSFAMRFLGRAADDPVAEEVNKLALDVGLAKSHDDLREASERLAKIIQTVGPDSLPRFVAEVVKRARDPATIMAIERSQRPPDASKEAIRPVYPVETIVALGAAGLAGGTTAAIRAAGGAILRQVGPRPAPPIRNAGVGDLAGTTKPVSEIRQAQVIPLSRSRFGHTFETHGENATKFLTKRAEATGKPNGQFLDNQAAARFIQDNIAKTKGGPVSVPIPEDFPARIINPDGSFSSARFIRLVPSGNGVKTAYPVP